MINIALEHGVRNRLFGLFAALTLTIMSLGWVAYSYLEHQIRGEESRKLQAVAQLKADQLGGWLTERTSSLDMLCANPLLAEAVSRWRATGDALLQKKIEAIFADVLQANHYQSMVLMDQKGAVLLQAGDLHPVTEELQEAALQAWREKRVVSTNLYLSRRRLPEHIHLDFAAPLRDTGVVLVVRSDPRHFLFPFIQSWPVPSASAETLLVRKDGDYVVYLNELRHRQDGALKLRLPLSMASTLPAARAVLQGGAGSFEGRDYRGVSVVAAHHAVPYDSWMVIAKIDEDEALLPLRRLSMAIAAGVIAAILAAGAATLYFLRRRETALQAAMLQAQGQQLRTFYLLEVLAESIHDPIYAKDGAGRTLLCNPAAALLFGISEKLFQAPLSEGGVLTDGERQVIENRQAVSSEETHVTAEGVRAYSCTRGPLCGGDGNVIGVFGILHDITKRKELEKKLLHSRNYHLKLFQDFPNPVWQSGVDGKCAYFNHAWLHFTGRTLQQEMGEGWTEGVHPEDLGYCLHTYREAFQAHRHFDMEYRLRRADGQYGWIYDSGTPIYELNGDFAGYIGSCIDITERKQLEQSLKEFNNTLEQRVEEETAKNREKDRVMLQQARHAAMGEMIGNIAHQWRQPLNGLALVLQNVRLDYADQVLEQASMDEYSEAGARLIEKMSTTIDDFRNFFNPNKEMQDFGLRRAAEDTLAILSAGFENSNIAVELEAGEEIAAYGYPNEFSQVLLNLLNNAKDALVANHIANGVIHIRLASVDGQAALAVRDNGGGIPADILAKIFDPYFTTKEKGTGIGLYMSKMIIEDNMGGRITAHNVEGGAEFCLSVPLANAGSTL